jgi:hypothetical protein
MTGNTFPMPRKAPFAVVLLALILSSCLSQEGSEYDVPAGEMVQKLQLRIDADGTPVLLAEVAMFYGTKARLQPWESPYIQANVQTIAYTRTAGGWNKHAFRNVKRDGILGSVLVSDYKEEVRALVADRSDVSLFERDGGSWIRKTASKGSNGYTFQTLPLSSGVPAVLLEGDGAWQSLIINYEDTKMKVLNNDGSSFALDTGMEIMLVGAVSRAEFNMVLGARLEINDKGSRKGRESGLYSYAWSLGAADPEPRKRKISERNFAALFFAKVDGQDRMYGHVPPDTLAEFAMQGEELVFRRDLDLPIDRKPGLRTDPKTDPESDPGTESKPVSRFPDEAALMVDPSGCVHYVKMQSRPSVIPGEPGRPPVYTHGSTCRAGVDTLVLPEPDTIYAYQTELTGFRFSPQGELMVGLFQIRVSKGPNRYSWGATPSRIYLASLKDRTWGLESIAEFEGSGED